MQINFNVSGLSLQTTALVNKYRLLYPYMKYTGMFDISLMQLVLIKSVTETTRSEKA